MIEKLRLLFTKDPSKKEKIQATDSPTSITDIHISNVETMLNIKCPYIQPVACIFSTYIPEYKQRMDIALPQISIDEIPSDAEFIAGKFDDANNRIIVATQYLNCINKNWCFNALTLAEQIFSLIHELRHVWQYKYEYQTYYQSNAVGMENVEDIAEIDADAFALAYLFSSNNSFTYKDFPNQIQEICLAATLDGGKRWHRAKELAQEYDLNCTAKLNEFREHADYNEINYLISQVKIKGGI